MEDNPKKIEVEIDLNWDTYPEETKLISDIIKAGNLGSFIYVTIADIVSGKYNMQESQTQSLLDNVVETVTSIYKAMTGLDSNVLDLVKVVNAQANVYEQLEDRINTGVKLPDTTIEDITPIKPITITPEDIDLDTSSMVEDEEGLDVEGMDDLFIL